jgi:HEAT repeat protein
MWDWCNIGENQAMSPILKGVCQMTREMLLFACAFLVSVMMISCESQEKKIESLMVQLDDRDVKVRHAAVMELSKMDEPVVIPALIKALADESEPVYSVATEALVQIGPPAVPALVTALGDKAVDVRQHAAEALGRAD